MSAVASIRNGTAATAAVLFLFSLPLGAQTQEAQKSPAPAAATPQKAEYVGSETCQACHEDIFNAFIKRNAHAAVDKDKRRGWEGRACEACHGPGSAHAEAGDAVTIRNPAKQPPAQVDKSCLTCHANQPTHIGRVQSGHARSQVSCASCHTVHAPPPAPSTASRASRTNQQCAACHISERASFNRPHGHAVNQGAMSCTDCHNPHGSLLAKSQTTAIGGEPGCLKCHSDKRGPFAFEHAPVRLEGCTTCHEPHGSANPRMLTRANVTQQCLECHANIGLPSGTATGKLGGIPPAFHDLRSARFRNCTVCHIKIHGSHVNKALLK
jgi:DmsE family decaheme c-type cytochrome